MLDIVAVPVLTDNYVWLIHNAESGETAVVDPSVADPVLEAAAARGWRLTQILNTHWHPDHTGGNEGIQQATGCTIIAPAEAKRVSNVDRIVGEGDRVTVAGREGVVWDIPAHTAGHIAYYFEDERMIFVGDTMFAMGCGRLFEGTAEQMYRNLRRIVALPEQVLIYCGHEYTLAKARFDPVGGRPGWPPHHSDSRGTGPPDARAPSLPRCLPPALRAPLRLAR